MADVFHRIPVRESHDESAHLRLVRFDFPPELAAAHAVPGQVVKARAPGQPEAYLALASAPGAAHAELLVKRGAPSADAIAAATNLELTVPFGKGFPVDTARGRDVLLFAAGSGIAPIRAVIQHLLSHRPDFGRSTLFYGQRAEADFAFRSEHLAWERAGIRVVLCASQPSGDTLQRGHVQDAAQAIAFAGQDPRGAVAFVCGMKPMVEGVRDALRQAGLPPELVFQNF
jgi:NAD(P)H-flavin reductase